MIDLGGSPITDRPRQETTDDYANDANAAKTGAPSSNNYEREAIDISNRSSLTKAGLLLRD